ncbi:MAG: Arc family DNA-binding protein [Acidobacteria bacterium]|nr:Arc family DNA-binding protein [Acidobacteriota bacterium]
MANVTVRNIPEDVHAVLREEAKRNARSLNAEIVATLSDRAQMSRRRKQAAKALREIDRIREKIAKQYPDQPDSVELLREDRYGR